MEAGMCYQFDRNSMRAWVWWQKEELTLHWNIFGVGGWFMPFAYDRCEDCSKVMRKKDSVWLQMDGDEEWSCPFCQDCIDASEEEKHSNYWYGF